MDADNSRNSFCSNTSVHDYNTASSQNFSFFLFAFFLYGLLVSIILIKKLNEKGLPLIKRTATVSMKKEVYNARYESLDSYIIFMFPDNETIKFTVDRKAYKALAERERVILKYKMIGKDIQRPVYYGYERLDEKPTE